MNRQILKTALLGAVASVALSFFGLCGRLEAIEFRRRARAHGLVTIGCKIWPNAKD